MKTQRHGTVRTLKDRHDTGFAGFGYGGEHLFAVALVDVFDPPWYLVRADSLSDADEVATECLVDTVDDRTIAWALTNDQNVSTVNDANMSWEALESAGLTTSPGGRTIWSENDIRITHLCCDGDAWSAIDR